MNQPSPDLTLFIQQQRQASKVEDLPLNGKRVLDLSTVIAAPFAAALLGDAGAEVIKIENPAAPDALRSWGTHHETGIEPFHAVIGRNKLPITINLKRGEGREIFQELIKKADVLIENMRPGVMGRLGLSHEQLLEINPGLIIGKVSGFGMSGPKAELPGFGTVAEAYSGFSYLNGTANSGPTSPPNALADMTTGVHLAFAVSLALLGQERGAKGGQVIDMSLYEPLFGYLGGEFLSYKLTGENPEPIGNELRAAAPRNVYRTRDGRWIALSCSSQKPWEDLARVMKREELIKDPRFLTNNDRIRPENRAALNDIIQDWHSTKTESEILALFRQKGITAGPVMTMAAIDNDEHFQQRGSFATVQDPATGVELKMPNVPIRLLGQTGHVRFPGLPQGSANRAIYQDLLGYNSEMIEDLGRGGVI
jgi:formyl-CoA transferase